MKSKRGLTALVFIICFVYLFFIHEFEVPVAVIPPTNNTSTVEPPVLQQPDVVEKETIIEKIVEVPVEKIVQVPVKVPVYYEKIVEVEVPVEKIVEVPVEVPVEVITETVTQPTVNVTTGGETTTTTETTMTTCTDIVDVTPIVERLGTTDFTAIENGVIEYMNQERANLGIGRINNDYQLYLTAIQKSQDMANKNYFDHQAPDGTMFTDIYAWNGVQYNGGAENILYDYSVTAYSVYMLWYNSEGHRNSMLNPLYTRVGCAIVYDEDSQRYYATQHFAN